jgi:hypothetical protein
VGRKGRGAGVNQKEVENDRQKIRRQKLKEVKTQTKYQLL